MSPRKSRARVQIDWDAIFASLPTDGYADVETAPHLTTVQMRDRLQQVANARGVGVDCIIALGHLMAKIEVDDVA